MVSQAEARIKRELSEEFEPKIGELRQVMQDGFAGIASIFENHNDQLDSREKRIGRLESKAA